MKLPLSARRAITRHITRAVSRLDPARYRQEPAYVAALFGRLDEIVYRGRDLTIEFTSTIVSDRGRQSAESVWGADFGIVAKVQTRDKSIAKGAFGQAKHGPLDNLAGEERERFRSQVVKMSNATAATLALELPVMAGEVPHIRVVFPIATAALIQDAHSATSLHNGELILPRDVGEPTVVLGGRWSLDDYLCHELLFCRHGDRREIFVRALEQSTLATLVVKVDERITQQTDTADLEPVL